MLFILFGCGGLVVVDIDRWIFGLCLWMWVVIVFLFMVVGFVRMRRWLCVFWGDGMGNCLLSYFLSIWC